MSRSHTRAALYATLVERELSDFAANPRKLQVKRYGIGDYVVAILDLTYNFKRTNLAYGIPPIILRIFDYVKKCKYGCAHLVLPKEWIGKWVSVSRVSEQQIFIMRPNNYGSYTIKTKSGMRLGYSAGYDWNVLGGGSTKSLE